MNECYSMFMIHRVIQCSQWHLCLCWTGLTDTTSLVSSISMVHRPWSKPWALTKPACGAWLSMTIEIASSDLLKEAGSTDVDGSRRLVASSYCTWSFQSLSARNSFVTPTRSLSFLHSAQIVRHVQINSGNDSCPLRTQGHAPANLQRSKFFKVPNKISREA